ncbi:Peptidase M15 [compost metagenome]
MVPLDAFDPVTKRPVSVRWSAPAGKVLDQQSGSAWQAPAQTGLYRLEGRAQVEGRVLKRTLSAFVTVPSDAAKDGAINGYRVGRYPALASRSARSFAMLPSGFIRLDAESAQAPVSRSFKLGQFAVKDGPRAEKYMMLSPRLLEKLERIVDALNAQGYPARSLRIMSGYRTPAYNAGIGNKTTLSRHTYGDAADVLADDWDRDGAITRRDAEILYRIADKLDRSTPLTGGLSLYKPTASHGWFVHVDTRGKAARW